jgi:hypothetical protein
MGVGWRKDATLGTGGIVGIVTVEPKRRKLYVVRYSRNLGPLT